jgi:ABC-type sugar transport system substrate-binding protein
MRYLRNCVYSFYCITALPDIVQASTDLHIAFFSPGHERSDNPTGQFWPESSKFANAVAVDLNIRLDTYYAQRNYLKMQQQIASVLRGKDKPDYLLLVNERFALTPQIRDINQSGIPFFLAYNHLQKQNTAAPILIPRQHYKNWIGSLVPDNHYAGAMLADTLIQSIAPSSAKILVLAGDNLTSAAKLREQGLRETLKKYPNAQILERLVGEWEYDTPRKRVLGAMRRHSAINVIWSANGAMALGALDALKDPAYEGKRPLIGSINWDPEEITAIKQNEIAVSIGGHFMTAGISLILLHDYHQGIDFKHDGGSYQQRRLFHSITAADLGPNAIIENRDWREIDFRGFSKYHNRQITRYDFSPNSLLKAIEKPQ